MTTESSQPEAAERVSVSLIPKASRELAALQADTGMSRSDLVNRAVSLYAFVHGQLKQDHELAVHRPADGSTQIVHLL